MLRNLQINNLALVKQIELEFSSGLNIITGETGAGKSILINALSAVLGERFLRNWQGNFANQTIISATFDLNKNHSLIKHLKKLAYLDDLDEFEGDLEINIRRVINKNLTSNLYLNGQKISTKEMGNIAAELIDIHSQHSQQSLMNSSFQRDLLDQYAQIDLSSLKTLDQKIKQIDQKITQTSLIANNPEKKELISFYLQELFEANLDDGELNSIESDYKQVSEIEKIKQNLALAESIINDSDLTISSQLSSLTKAIDEIVKSNPNFAENLEILDQISIGINTIEENLAHYYQKIESSKSLEELESRLNQLDQLARKHQCKIENLLEIQEKLNTQLSEFENYEIQFDELENQKKQLTQLYQIKAKEVSKLRQQKALELSEKIESKLKDLAMKQAKLKIEIISNDKKISPYGIDEIEFKVSLNQLNPKENDFLPLKKVASGGELSRISLAIESELAQLVKLNCLVFDEVDSGIGGDTANQVANSLNQLAKNHQVICITHLAQIAVFGNNHLVVEKELDENKQSKQNTIISKKLNQKEDRVLEIARMISGNLHSQTSLVHAKKMLEFAQND